VRTIVLLAGWTNGSILIGNGANSVANLA
jgi:hypothetical protein